MKPKIRTIYDNFDLYNLYSNDAKECMKSQGILNPDENMILSKIAEIDAERWTGVKRKLEDFFDGSKWLIFGMTSNRIGDFQSGHVFNDFNEMYGIAMKDFDYHHIYDVNGHLYLKCSENNGKNSYGITNYYEIRKLTDRGVGYLSRWEESNDVTRNGRYVHDRLAQLYSVLPNFMRNVHCLPKIENLKDKEN